MSELKTLQHWLGALIAQPLQSDHKICEKTPFGTSIKQESEKFVAPSPTLAPYRRVEIYHQQYWWRLIDVMQTHFPATLRLFGYQAFQNQLVIPYLSANPPKHWALAKLGDTFTQWLEKNYTQEDRNLVIKLAEIDWAASEVFLAQKVPPLDFAALAENEIQTKVLFLQPHIHLFHLNGDLFSFREAFIKEEPEYYDSNPFPSITYGDYYFVLYSTCENQVTWTEISVTEHWILTQFKRGDSIENVCAKMEELQGDMMEEALAQMPLWFKQWTVLQWLRQ